VAEQTRKANELRSRGDSVDDLWRREALNEYVRTPAVWLDAIERFAAGVDRCVIEPVASQHSADIGEADGRRRGLQLQAAGLFQTRMIY
jgi:hypothetical protein